MNELIKIEARELAGATVQTCNARDLWQFVESKMQFADWIKGRIEKYGFVEGEDWVIQKIMNNPAGGRPTLDYHLTIEMAKELAMVENNEKGRAVRRYFIECERAAKSAPAADPMAILADPAAMRGLLLTYTDKVIALEAQVAEQAPKADAFDLIGVSENDYTITTTAKLLNIVPHNKLFQYLHAEQWIYKNNGRGPWLPHVPRIRQGLMRLGGHPIQHSDGRVETEPQARVTGKGLAKLALIFGVPLQGSFPMISRGAGTAEIQRAQQ